MSITDDVILEQVEYTFDAAGNAILAVTRERYHNAVASQTGSLDDPSTAPKARVTYVAFYHDPLGRVIATADYGTNGGTALTRPATIPARSDHVLVTTFAYDPSGNLTTITDAAGQVTDIQYDARGREIERILNDVGSLSSSSSSSSSNSGDCQASDDRNLSIRRTYTPDGNLATMTVVNAKTGDQTTTFTYGTTLADSDIATSNLKWAEVFADSAGGSDQIQYSYDRQGQLKQTTDQNGTVHVLERDKLGRVIHDRVTVLGTGVDGTVRRISTTYDVLGRKSKVTSWNNASVTSGSIVNEAQFVYDNFGRLITDYQSHGGAVNTSTTPKVQYGFADGSANTVRPTSLTCPNGRVLTFDYSTSGSMPDACSRIDSIKDSSQTLVQYSYLGLRKFVTADYQQPSLKWTLADLSGSNDPDTGDIYSGLDRFSRVKDNRWYNYGTSTDVDRIKHGYDRVGNRLYRQNTVATANGAAFDELCTYDGVNRLHEIERGTLNGTQSAILSPVFTECWTQDSTANWSGYRQGTNPGSWNLVQQRSVNKVNEIVSFANSVGSAWATPAYDPAGNMTTFPKASDPTTAQTAVYDAWYRLVKVSEGANTVAAYQYDGINRRTIQQIYTSGTLTETRHFYYTTPSQWQVIEERIGTATIPERQFVWGLRYVDDLVLRDRDTNGDGTLDERQYALQDANWNVTAIINSSGSVQERYAYSPYGVPVFLTSSFGARSSSSFDWRNLFTGRRLDTETGLYDFRYRVLSPLVGLFLARDPLGLPDGPSLYAAWFVPDSVDPYGLQIPTSGQCWIGLGNKTICIGDVIPTGPITLDFNLDEDSGFPYLSYIFNVPVNTYAVTSIQDAKNALDKYISNKAHEAAKCGKPVCVPSITLAGHGSTIGYIQFKTGEVIFPSSIDYYLAFINGQPLSPEYESGPAGPGNVVTSPPSNLRELQILSEMISKLCDNGRLTILMCSVGTDTFNQQLRRLATQLGKPNIEIVTYKGDCGYSFGGGTKAK